MTEALHPMIDGAGDGWIATQTRRPVAALDTAVADFLARTVADGRRPLVISGPDTRMTQPLWNALRGVAGAWVVQTEDAFFEAASGVTLAAPADALTASPSTGATPHPAWGLSPLATRLQVVFTVATRHRVSRPLRLGGPAAALVESLTGAPPHAWGATEPITARWDRDALTASSRRRMPNDSLWCFRGRPDAPVIGTIQIARTAEGIEETTHLWADISGPGSARSHALTGEALDALRSAAAHGMPLLGLALAQIGVPALERLPVQPTPPAPLALLIGPPGVRATGLAAQDWVTAFGSETLGRPRLPAVLTRLGSTNGGGWERLDTLVARLGADRVRELLALAPIVGAQLDGVPHRDTKGPHRG